MKFSIDSKNGYIEIWFKDLTQEGQDFFKKLFTDEEIEEFRQRPLARFTKG